MRIMSKETNEAVETLRGAIKLMADTGGLQIIWDPKNPPGKIGELTLKDFASVFFDVGMEVHFWCREPFETPAPPPQPPAVESE
jgi:hypothetical protein